jgi:hypothetical protein
MKKYLIFLGLITLILFSCTLPDQSVYWAVINAVPEVDNSLNNNLTVVAMASDSTNNYIAAGTSIYYRPAGTPSGSWTSVPLPSDVALCTALTNFTGPRIYAGFMFSNGTHGLYYTDVVPPTAPGNWNAVTAGVFAANPKQIVRLMTVGVYVLISVCNYDGTNNLLYYSDGSTYANTGLPVQTVPILDATVWGGTYFAITKTSIFSGALGAMAFLANKPTGAGDLGGIFRSSTHSLFYLSASNGIVFTSPDASTWTASSAVSVNSKAVVFTEFAEVNGNVLVGTNKNGFFQMTDGTLAALGAPPDLSLKSPDLYLAWVLRFFVDGNTVYFLTAGKGLYSNAYSVAPPAGWSATWTHE